MKILEEDMGICNIFFLKVSEMIKVSHYNTSFSQYAGQYPGMDFSIHCDTSDKVGGSVQCPSIQNAIRLCHQHGKKLLLGIGGSNAVQEFTRFEDEQQAEQLASDLWNLFLGGTEKSLVRPFGRYH